MISKFSKWMLYSTSYFPVYILLILRLILSPQDSAESFYQSVSLNFVQYKHAIIVLSGLILLSIIVLVLVKKPETNERIRDRLVKNCTGEMVSFFVPSILSLLTIGIDLYGWILCIAIFVITGFLVLQSDWIRICPIFFFLKYRLYQTACGTYVLSLLNIEQFNQLLLDQADGIEVKAITPRLYLAPRDQRYFKIQA